MHYYDHCLTEVMVCIKYKFYIIYVSELNQDEVPLISTFKTFQSLLIIEAKSFNLLQLTIRIECLREVQVSFQIQDLQ